VPLLGWANVALLSTLQGVDLDPVFRPAEALALPPSAQGMFLAANGTGRDLARTLVEVRDSFGPKDR
jgi:hypothetical protein